MTTTPAAPLTTCPNWCTLEPGHDWDTEHPDGPLSRSHTGPRFGYYVHTEAVEFSDQPGKILTVSRIDAFGDDLDRADLIGLAISSIEAAAWLRDVAGVES